MRCSKCGSYIDNNSERCPVCGDAFIFNTAEDEIQEDIKGKVEDILGSGEDKNAHGQESAENEYPDRESKKNKYRTDDRSEWVDDPDGYFEDEDGLTVCIPKELMEDDNGLTVCIPKDEMEDDNGLTVCIPKDEMEDEDDEGLTTFIPKGRVVKASSFTDVKNRPAASKNVHSNGVRHEFEKDIEDKESEEEPPKRTNKRPKVKKAKKAKRNNSSRLGLILALIAALFVVAAIVLLLSTGEYKKWVEAFFPQTQEKTTIADNLTCNITDGAEYSLPLEITMESSEGNRIYYTLDGSAPNNASAKYTGPIEILASDIEGDSAEYELRAVTYTSTSIKKVDFAVKFTVKLAELKAPEFSLEGGDYYTAQGITITAEKGSTIYYTYDGSTPTDQSNRYSGTVPMKRGYNTLSAIAVNGDRISGVTQVTYHLDLAEKISYDNAENLIKSRLTAENYRLSDTAPTTTTAPTKPTQTTKPGETTTAPPPTETTTMDPTKTAIVTYYEKQEISGDLYYVFYASIYNSNGGYEDEKWYGVDDQNGVVADLYWGDGSLHTYW